MFVNPQWGCSISLSDVYLTCNKCLSESLLKAYVETLIWSITEESETVQFIKSYLNIVSSKPSQCQSKLYPVSPVPDVSCGVNSSSKENKVWREHSGHWISNPAYIKGFRFHSGNTNLFYMDPVQSVFAEQFFPAAAILSNTYACEQNCIWWKGLGNTLTSLWSSEKEETMNQEDSIPEKEETKIERSMGVSYGTD